MHRAKTTWSKEVPEVKRYRSKAVYVSTFRHYFVINLSSICHQFVRIARPSRHRAVLLQNCIVDAQRRDEHVEEFKIVQDSSRRPKITARRPMTAPRSVWAGLSCRRAVRPRVVLAQSCPSQGCPVAQDELKTTQDGPRRSQDEPKTSPRWPKINIFQLKIGETIEKPRYFNTFEVSAPRAPRTLRDPGAPKAPSNEKQWKT